eukprot:Polyplicarium_translucidae@DN5171_c0_g1_i1.p1
MPIVDGSYSTNKLNVGPQHQVPGVPSNYLEALEHGVYYSSAATGDALVCRSRLQRGLSECRLVFSPALWAAAIRRAEAQRVAVGEDSVQTAACQSAGNVPSSDAGEGSTRPPPPTEDRPSVAVECVKDDSHERLKAEAASISHPEGPGVPPFQGIVSTAEELNRYQQLCEDSWPVTCAWPYSPEWAFKLLHFADFDFEVALAILEDSHFSLKEICDFPCRPYMNKWKPTDRRGHIPSTPFPISHMFKFERRHG